MTPVAASAEERDGVAALLELLRDESGRQVGEHAYKFVSPTGEIIEVPQSVYVLLSRVIEVLARGDAIAVVPVGKELTTQQAADILNVSRQYLVRLLDEGRLPYRRTGSHRRLRVEDVLAFKQRRDRERKEALDDLARFSEEYGGYEEIPREG